MKEVTLGSPLACLLAAGALLAKTGYSDKFSSYIISASLKERAAPHINGAAVPLMLSIVEMRDLIMKEVLRSKADWDDYGAETQAQIWSSVVPHICETPVFSQLRKDMAFLHSFDDQLWSFLRDLCFYEEAIACCKGEVWETSGLRMRSLPPIGGWKVDGGGRPHSSKRMIFPDGWNGFYVWHGMYVPPEVMEGPFDADAIDKQRNAEFRRVMLDRTYDGKRGMELYFEARKFRELQTDEVHGRQRRLLSSPDGGLRVIEVQNGSLEPDGTRRKFILGTSWRWGDPHEAIAASYGINPRIYQEAVRT